MPQAAQSLLSRLTEKDAEAVLRLAAVSVRHKRRNALASYTRPELRGDALRLWDSRQSEVVLSGPAETGKTYASLARLNALMWDNPGAQAAIIRKTYASMHGSVLQTFRRILGKDTRVHAYGGDKPEWFDYPNGSRVFVGGMDNPQKVLSSERDIIYVNQAEELELGDWETLTTRATGRGGVMPYAQVYGDCNPGPATHWIINRPSLKVLYSHHEDNPTLFDEQGVITEQGVKTLAVLDALTGIRKKRLRYGLWVAAEGMVYEDWDRSVNVLDMQQLQALGIFTEDGTLDRTVVKDVIAGVDWGFTNPGVIQAWAVDGDGRAYLVHEVYRTGKLIDWWVAQAHTLKSLYGIRQFYCDPSEPAYIEAFVRAGLSAVQAVNDIAPGIQVVQARIAPAKDGRPRLYVYQGALQERDAHLDEVRRPQGFIEELESYVWQQARDGKTTKEEPVKADDHAMDVARYSMQALEQKPPAPVRVVSSPVITANAGTPFKRNSNFR